MATFRPLRVAFAGTPQFAVPPLQSLLASRHRVVGVFTQPDRPKGRGRQLSASPVKQLARAHGLPVAQPPTLRDPTVRSDLAALQPDIMVVVAYGQILPPQVLTLPQLGCLNIHASLLPRWRGAAPIQRAILGGDSHTGVTLMRMDEGLDTGGILAMRSLPIDDRATSASLHDALAALGSQCLIEVLDSLATGPLQARPQPQEGVSYAGKIAKSEAIIDWTLPAAAISRQVRAFNPWPVAETRFAGEQLRIHEAYAPGATGPAAADPGTWLGLAPGPSGEVLRVACGAGELQVTQLQRAGRKPVTAREFVNSAGADAGRFG
ncbi:MAG TPA: methionyl-tRNA formyltransferase [Steroidobacteraceae bacterium]|nr:methionyl-tRNA formyltransferase [Steroidobacteraceae bacterium]